MPELHVAYIRSIWSIKENQEAIGNLYGKLMDWAVLRFPETKALAVRLSPGLGQYFQNHQLQEPV